MKKTKLKPEEVKNDIDGLINLINSLENIDIDSFNIKDFEKTTNELVEKLEKKYKPLLPSKEDLDTKE